MLVRSPWLPVLVFALFGVGRAYALVPAHTPTLSVHESCYGSATADGRRASIQGLDIRLISYAGPEHSYQVQCFFLKKTQFGGLPHIDDTVIFDVTSPHATFGVLARPIKLSGAPKPATASSKPPKKSKVSSGGVNPVGDYPREGFVVRVLCNGEVLCRHASSHRLERLSVEQAGIFNDAASGKSARHLDAAELLKR